MRASGLSQDFGRGAAVIRYGDAESEYRDKARGAAPGREERPPRMRGGFFLIVRMGREALFRKSVADAV